MESIKKVKGFLSNYKLYFKIISLVVIVVFVGYFVVVKNELTVNASIATDDSFSLVILPDAQQYTNASNNTGGKSYNDIFKAQTNWIMANRVSKNIAYVLQEGDITDSNDNDADWRKEWLNAKDSMDILNGADGKVNDVDGVPYAISPGNHDILTSAGRDDTYFNSFFPISKFKNFSDNFDPGKLDNASYAFRAGNKDWLILTLEVFPRNEVLTWANDVVARYPNHIVIVLTHSYLYSDEEFQGTPGKGHDWTKFDYQIDLTNSNDGIGIWQKLVQGNKNIKFVFNGHVLHDTTIGAVSYRIDTRDGGISKVYQMLANYQDLPEGGSGYLRLLTFNTKNGTVDVKTYSPYLNTYLTDPKNQFTLSGVDFGVSAGPRTLKYDYNTDGAIGIEDFRAVLSHWGASGGTYNIGPLNNSCANTDTTGKVDGYDLQVILSCWGVKAETNSCCYIN
jgi:hypothetical protein